jgi:hypothetical protein
MSTGRSKVAAKRRRRRKKGVAKKVKREQRGAQPCPWIWPVTDDLIAGG